MNETTAEAKQPPIVKRGAPDAGKYFRYMAEFVGFTPADEQAIIKTKPILEKHLARIVSEFYEHLLRYPPTRRFFLDKQGNIDVPYLELRMRHNANFWRRTVEGNYDDDYASYIDYVGRAHTSHGADSSIYIAERYVIGMVGFISHAMSHAIMEELHEKDEDFEHNAIEAWDKLMMVVLEMLARAYYNERVPETFEPIVAIDEAGIEKLAEQAVAKEMGKRQSEDGAPGNESNVKSVTVARANDIPDGERKIVEVDGISIGIFHHNGTWYALHNSCLHRGGPVCTGALTGDVIECPWHGFQYDVRDGHLLTDPKSHLDTFRVSVEDGEVKLDIPQ